MIRSSRAWLYLTPMVLAVALLVLPSRAAAQINREIRDRVAPAAVEIAAQMRWTENDFELMLPLPIGSGTIVSNDGLILTNHHVVDLSQVETLIGEWNEDLAGEMPGVTVELASTEFVILVSEGNLPPVARYTARVVTSDPLLDLAVLRVISDASGGPEGIEGVVFPFVPLGDSDAMGLGDRVHVFSYPAIGGDVLTYTEGAVSGFQRQEGIDGVAWITTDAVLSGGSSGGTAINDAGELIGVPTQGSELDCRPGDINGDGVIDAQDIGCIPTGGSLGQLRPSNQALALLQVAAQPALTPTPRPRRLIGAETPQPEPEPAQEHDLDLPRLALYPADLARLGFAGYAVDWGQLTDAAGASTLLAIDSSWGAPLAETGVREIYLLRNVFPSLDAGASTYVTTTLWEYPDDAAAATGFDLVERQIEGTLISTDEPAGYAVSDESELTTWTFTDLATGEPMTAVEMTFRVQHVVAAVRVAGPSLEDARLRNDVETLSLAFADRLGAALVESVSAEAPLSARIVRVVDDGAGSGGDYYLMQDGEAVPLYWFASPETAREWTGYWRQLGVHDAYETEIFLPVDPEVTGPRARVGVRLYAFDTESDASAFVSAFEEDLRGSGAMSVRELSDAPHFGDESRTFQFETDWWSDVDPEFRTATTIRVGRTVASIEVGAAAAAPLEVISQIAARQESCLERGCSTLTFPAAAWLLEPHGSGASVTTETPVSSPTPPPPQPTPTPSPAPLAWGIDEPFDDPGVAPEGTDVSTVQVSDGRMTLGILEAGGLDGFVFDGMPSEGRDIAFAVDVDSTSGWGEITLRLGTATGDTEWFFAIDPVTNQWSLYRTSIYTNELFYWVEPREFTGIVPGTIERLEVRVKNGRPVLLINGVDVVSPTGIAMPEMRGSLVAGFGAGINPYSLTGFGETFTVVIDRVTLVELSA